MPITAGIDVGTGCVKAALFEVTPDGTTWLGRTVERVRQRDPYKLAADSYDAMLRDQRLTRDDVAYLATTGDGENLTWSTGHFYSMTTHARGAVYLDESARAVLDIGSLHGRAIRIDHRGKVLSYRMTSQCASGSGQFLENIARYLGVAQDEVGPLSLEGTNPEKVSSICAVLAETDVINMVSRGISSADILRGIHVSMAGRLAALVRRLATPEGTVLVTGGLAMDVGMVDALRDALAEAKVTLEARTHPDAIYAGAIGAALWGAYRYERLRAAQAERTPA
jgi:benzoyl-CoA reductase subunit D